MGTEVLGPASKNQLHDLVLSDDRLTFKNSFISTRLHHIFQDTSYDF